MINDSRNIKKIEKISNETSSLSITKCTYILLSRRQENLLATKLTVGHSNRILIKIFRSIISYFIWMKCDLLRSRHVSLLSPWEVLILYTLHNVWHNTWQKKRNLQSQQETQQKLIESYTLLSWHNTMTGG